MGTKSRTKPRGEEEDRRRHRRVEMLFDVDGSQSLMGAEAEWSDGQRTLLYDMSYTGAALGRPSGLELTVGLSVPLLFHLKGASGVAKKAGVSAEIIWFNEKLVGVDFSEQEAFARRELFGFLDDKVIGTNLREVHSKYFDKDLDCDHWWIGPNETNVFIWSGKESVVKATIEFDDRTLIYSAGNWHNADDKVYIGRVVDVLSQIQSIGPTMKALMQTLVRAGRED